MRTTAICLVIGLAVAGCGDGDAEPSGDRAADPSGLTGEQLENGIGPVTELELGAFDAALAAQGEEIFVLKCSACHKPDERYVGPALRDVTLRRTPAYVMNMILNPEEMVQRHPEAKALLAQFMTPMANQNLTREEARAVLEYLRSLAANEPETGGN